MPQAPIARLLTAALLVCAALVLSAAPAHAAGACPNTSLVPSSANLATIRASTLCLLNIERTSRGLTPLATNRDLAKAADRYSRLMVREKFFNHVSPRGSTPTSRIRSGTRYLRGARSWALGENIAWGTGDRASPASMVASWMLSPGHRANILAQRFRHIGIGVAPGAPMSKTNIPGATYTTDFGRRS